MSRSMTVVVDQVTLHVGRRSRLVKQLMLIPGNCLIINLLSLKRRFHFHLEFSHLRDHSTRNKSSECFLRKYIFKSIKVMKIASTMMQRWFSGWFNSCESKVFSDRVENFRRINNNADFNRYAIFNQFTFPQNITVNRKMIENLNKRRRSWLE